MNQFNPAVIGEFAIWYVVFLFSLTVHEGAHALASWLGGDDTAYQGGQVTINPVPHVKREPFGTVLVPLISFFSAGWMMGWASTPYDPEWSRRHPRRQALMAMAGPLGNFAVALIAFVALRMLLAGGVLDTPYPAASFERLAVAPDGTADGSPLVPLAMLLSVALSLNVLLGLFNLIPLPPLDGAGVLQGLFPESVGRFLENMQAQPMFGLLGLLVAWRLFGRIAGPAFGLLVDLVHPGLLTG